MRWYPHGVCQLQLPQHPHGVYSKTLASASCTYNSIPTDSVHKRRPAVTMISPPNLQAAPAMAFPRQLQQNSGVGQLQLRWHPHHICTNKLTSNRYDGVPTASAGCSMPWHTHSSCTTTYPRMSIQTWLPRLDSTLHATNKDICGTEDIISV